MYVALGPNSLSYLFKCGIVILNDHPTCEEMRQQRTTLRNILIGLVNLCNLSNSPWTSPSYRRRNDNAPGLCWNNNPTCKKMRRQRTSLRKIVIGFAKVYPTCLQHWRVPPIDEKITKMTTRSVTKTKIIFKQLRCPVRTGNWTNISIGFRAPHSWGTQLASSHKVQLTISPISLPEKSPTPTQFSTGSRNNELTDDYQLALLERPG